jgi:DNA polymerase-4
LLITKIYESYSPLVEPFSIDEQHIDVTACLALFGCSPVELAQHIRMRVMKETGINIRIGIGENKILAKSACDNFAKKNDSGIYELSKEDLSAFWALDIQKMFGVGNRMMIHLHRCGISTIGDLAHTPLDKLKFLLKKRLGRQSDIQAEVLWRVANGIDESPVVPDAFEQQKGIGRQTTLPVDYDQFDDIKVVLLELAALVCQRSRQKGYLGNVVHAGAQGADFDKPEGFSRQMKLQDPTNVTKEVYAGAKNVFEKHWTGYPVRKLWVSLSSLQSDEVVQLTLFGEREKQMAVENTVDRIQERFGSNSIFLASSLKHTSQQQSLSKKIGGHSK